VRSRTPSRSRLPLADAEVVSGEHYEYRKGTSSKFWEIELNGRSFVTRYGRIGGPTQSTTKRFAGPSEAARAYKLLVAAKQREGYQRAGSITPAAGSAKAVAATPAGNERGRVGQALAHLDTLISRIPLLTPESTRKSFYWNALTPIFPSTAAQISSFERKTRRTLSPGGTELFVRGIPHGFIVDENENIFGSLRFQSLADIGSQLRWWGNWKNEAEATADTPDLASRVEQRRYGLPLWDDENSIVIDGRNGEVSRTSGEPQPSDVVAPALSEFLIHFVAAGCYTGRARKPQFARYQKWLQAVAPVSIPPKENLWLRHLDRWFDGNLTK
jgi:predicted DNA-binding WGR domain protein